MKPKNNARELVKSILPVAGILAASITAASAVTTVGVINPTPGGQTIVDSPINVGNANFLTVSDMGTLMTAAFANNTGGVINFDTAQGWNTTGATAFTVDYGVDQSQSLTLTRADGGGGNTFGQSTGAGTTQTSGDAYLGFQGSGSPMTFTFDVGLSAWGITQLNRFASRDVSMVFTLEDTSTISYSTQNQDPLGNNTGNLNWYGIQVTDANPITQVTITSNGFTRFDDMAFITAVPEPSSALLLGLAGFGVFIRRRR